MPLPKVQRNVQDQNGNIVTGVLGSVYNQGTGVLASLYQDDAGATPLSNPMTNDATYGSFKFYINPGHYDMTFTKPGYTFEPVYDFQVPEDVLTLGTMATQNADAVAITGGTVSLTALGAGRNYDPAYAIAVSGNTHLAGDATVTTRLIVVGLPTVGPFKLGMLYDPGAGHGAVVQNLVNNSGGGAAFQFCNTAGTSVGTIMVSNTATAYNTTSDARVKEAVVPLDGALDVLRRLRPVGFRWKADGSPGQGLLAHEVQAVVPTAVTGSPEGEALQGVDFSKFVPYLIGAVQELSQQVQVLAARLDASAVP